MRFSKHRQGRASGGCLRGRGRGREGAALHRTMIGPCATMKSKISPCPTWPRSAAGSWLGRIRFARFCGVRWLGLVCSRSRAGSRPPRRRAEQPGVPRHRHDAPSNRAGCIDRPGHRERSARPRPALAAAATRSSRSTAPLRSTAPRVRRSSSPAIVAHAARRRDPARRPARRDRTAIVHRDAVDARRGPARALRRPARSSADARRRRRSRRRTTISASSTAHARSSAGSIRALRRAAARCSIASRDGSRRAPRARRSRSRSIGARSTPRMSRRRADRARRARRRVPLAVADTGDVPATRD